MKRWIEMLRFRDTPELYGRTGAGCTSSPRNNESGLYLEPVQYGYRLYSEPVQ